MNFAIVEKDYIRQRIYPDFDWLVYPTPSRINPLQKPLHQCMVALVTTAGVHLQDDRPFNLTNRRGDHTFRVIPHNTPFARLALSHIGYDTKKIHQDINCVFPLERLRELAQEGMVGALAPRHLSFMGYIPITEPLLQETAPAVAAQLQEDAVDLVLLIPA
ncbi:MAG: glycine/sarcosine/betaine reductase selenoprotein B family protein [Candidatus Entotheonellia bacterium]